MTARKRFEVDCEVGRRTAWFISGDYRLVDALKTVRCPKMRDQKRKAWMVPIQYADDAIACIEFRFNGAVHVVAVDR